jgi:hypothetical protein
VSGGIYLMQSDELVEMTEQHYASEDRLQKLLVKTPNLLSGDQTGGSNPCRWLLVSREVSLAFEEDGAGRWSVDHLFLDQDAIPTLVEVERSIDDRIRREVVGQMLDYAANAVVYWPVEALRSRFEESREKPEQDLVGLLETTESDPEDFWLRVKANLQAGKVRLIFVADTIPAELRRVVEFLNQQMDPAEVLAVEIKQYVHQDSNLKTLVSRTVGQKTAPARADTQWYEGSFFKALELNQGTEEAATAKKILDWCRDDRLPRIAWNKSSSLGKLEPCLDHKDEPYWLIGVRTDGRVEVVLRWLKSRTAFKEEKKRRELVRRLNEILGVDIPTDRLTGHPTFPLSALRDKAALNQFLEVLGWFVQEVEGS